MSKIDQLSDLSSLTNEQSAVQAINDNNERIEEAFDNTLSRDGSSPNEMEAPLDMNSNRILNLPAPSSNLEPVRLQDIEDLELGNLTIINNTVDLANGNPESLASLDPILDTEDIIAIWDDSTNVMKRALFTNMSFTPLGTGAASMYLRIKLQNEVSVKEFGAVGNGIADDTNALFNWFTYLSTSGKRGFLDPGTYLVNQVALINCHSISARGVHGQSIIKGVAGTGTPVVSLDSSAFREYLWLDGITIDNSERDFVVADQSGTCLELKRWNGVLINFCRFVSTADFRDDQGDSGITSTFCQDLRVTNCYFQGQPDAAIYASGGPSTATSDDWGDVYIAFNKFQRCSNGVTTKRQHQRVVVIANSFIECRTGVSQLQAGSAPEVDPGRQLIVTSNYFKKCGSRCILAKAAVIFSNNIIEDWGYDPDGVADGGFVWAGLIHGTGGLYLGNHLSFREWSGVGRVGLRLANDVTPASGTLIPVGNTIDGNSFTGCDTGILENNNTTANRGTNFFNGVATPYVLAGGSTSVYGVHTPSGVLSGSGTILAIDGDATNPSISFINDANTGFFSAANNDLGITAGGGARLHVSSSELYPHTTNLYPLGKNANRFLSLLLGASGVIDFNNDIFLTYAADNLIFSGGTLTLPNVGLRLLDTNASHGLIVKPGSDITADRTLTITTGDVDRTFSLGGNLTTSGGNITVTVPAASSLTAPISGTLPTSLSQTGVVASVTGSTTETILATISVAAGTVGANSQLALEWQNDKTGTAGTWAVRVYIGAAGAGLGGTKISETAAIGATTISWHQYVNLSNANSLSAQHISGPGTQGGWGGATVANSTSAINTANAFDIVISVQLANAADTGKLSFHRLMHHYKA